jgi:hypothetical protein
MLPRQLVSKDNDRGKRMEDLETILAVSSPGIS